MKDMIKRIREERKGFTLAELLIVVAIIAVLVAIAIPVFNGQLEKSREATDAANIRAAYAEIMTAAVSSANEEDYNGITKEADGSYKATVKLVQKTPGWQNAFQFPKNLKGSSTELTAEQTVTITLAKDATEANIDISLAKKA